MHYLDVLYIDPDGDAARRVRLAWGTAKNHALSRRLTVLKVDQASSTETREGMLQG